MLLLEHRAAEKATPELKGLLVPMCQYHGGVCHEIAPCPLNKARIDGRLNKRTEPREKYMEARARYQQAKESGDDDAHD